MEILRTIQTNDDGTIIAVVNPKPKVSKTVFKTIRPTYGYHLRETRDPYLVECMISKDRECELVACNIDRLNRCAFVRVKDIGGIEFVTFVPIEDLELISGNLGIQAS